MYSYAYDTFKMSFPKKRLKRCWLTFSRNSRVKRIIMAIFGCFFVFLMLSNSDQDESTSVMKFIPEYTMNSHNVQPILSKPKITHKEYKIFRQIKVMNAKAFLIFPIIGERKLLDRYDNVILEEYRDSHVIISRIYLASNNTKLMYKPESPPIVHSDPIYGRPKIRRRYSPPLVVAENNALQNRHYNYKHKPMLYKNFKDYFELLKTPTGGCRRYVRMGGSLSCDKGKYEPYTFDGHKWVCVDSGYDLVRSRSTSPCLVLSFGVSIDTSFDMDIHDIFCNVHLFDVLNYNDATWKIDFPRFSFHQVGLSATGPRNILQSNVTMKLDTLQHLVNKYGLEGKLIHILKLDIEQFEWEVLDKLCDEALIENIGQIAVEVHSFPLKKLPSSQWAKEVQQYYNIIRKLQSRGFVLASYWENYNKHSTLTDDDGVEWIGTGEVLFLNSKWARS